MASTATSSVLSTLTRRLTHLSLQSSLATKRTGGVAWPSSVSQFTSPTTSRRSIQSLVDAAAAKSNSKSLTSSSAAKLRTSNGMLSSSSSLVNRAFSSSGDKTASEPSSSASEDRDSEWSKFQESLIFDETKLSGSISKKIKKRGGKTLRKKKARELELMKKQEGRIDDIGTGQFPSMRYSDEETERLLKEAYDNIPKRGISKKTRQIKRQRNRFRAIREARRIKKQEKIAHHFARMEKRSRKKKDVKRVIETADEIRENELMYQRKVLMKWAEIQGLAAVQSDDTAAVHIDDDDTELLVGDGDTDGEKKEEKM